MSTFNLWQIILPAIIIGAFGVSFFSIVQSDDQLNGFLELLQSKVFRALYIILGGITCTMMLTAESYDGIIELCKSMYTKGDNIIWLDVSAAMVITGAALAYMALLGMAMAIGALARPKSLRKQIHCETYRAERLKPKPVAEPPKKAKIPVKKLYKGCLHPREILSLFENATCDMREPAFATIGLHRGPDQSDTEHKPVFITVDPETLNSLEVASE